MGTRIALHIAARLISLILTSHLINVTQGSKVWGEVALPEDLEAEKASVRYPGVTDDEDFAADEASGDLPSGEEDGSTPEPSTVDKTVYFRALVNFTNSFVYTAELDNIESEAFREISDAVVDTLESEYNRIAGVQAVNVVIIRKIGADVFVELDVTSDYNSDNDQIRSVLYSVVEDGSIASYVTSVSGFEFRRLGEVVPSARPCLENEFTCGDGGCIPREYFCDKRPDCVDMSDELDCEVLSPPEVAPTPPKPLPDRQRPQLPVGGPCRVDQATCQNGECIPRDYLCDGERDCTDGSDEIKCGTPSPCEPNEFKCQNGRCALKLWRCDGDNDCGDNSDENYCPTKGPQDTCAPEQFMCVRDRTCIPASYQCDEEPDCADRSDEYDCSPPSVTRPPEESIKAQRGQTVTFTCTAVGVPTPIITWRLNWGHIPTSSRITVTSENGRGTLTIRDVKEGDQGAYTCEAINAKGMVFAIPDGVLSLVQSTGDCPSDHFSVEGGSRCIPCFCFGITKNCQNTGRYRNQIRLRFTEEDDFKGVNVSYPSRPGTPPLSSTQLLINPEMEEFQLVDLSRRFLVLESYWTLPRQFLGNKIDSYGGSLQYKVRYVLARGLSDPEEKPDMILVGNGQRLIYRRTKPTPPTVTNQKEVKFTEENWQHSSGRPVTREDLMMTLANLESVNIRTIYDNHMVSVALSDIVMDTSTVEYSIQGPAQSVEECRCPAGYSGLSCETCSAGFDRVSGGSFLGTCAGCNCHGHASDCDPVSGHCLRCQHNTEGAQCDKCRPGYFGDPRRGRPDDCKPCPCPYPETSRRFSDTCYLDQDNQVTCDACRPGYTGRRCESCAPGYQVNPLQPNRECVPSASSKCDSRGTVGPTGSRPCTCKSSVVGALCDECKTGSFHLTEGNPEGCLQCFCMGVTKQCASSSWSRDQVRGGVNGQLFALSNGANTRTITQGVIQKSSSEVAFRSFADVPIDIYYWVLPENFRGDKVTAYGGELRYTVRYEPRFRSLVIDGQPDVILQGNGIFLEHFSKTKPLPRIPATITVPFREGAWRRADGQPCTREHLIMALADTSVFMIRASYADNMAESSLSDIRMDIAVPHSTGQERALEVEECACPQGYRGPSCQECDVGYSRTGSGLYLGTCERCSCHGHASRCDPETGDCVQCQHNTVGPRCDRCASGYYGDPKTGGAAACQRCPCPGTSPGNQFSQTCYLASDGQPTCDSCPPGYTGRRCESTLDDCEDVFLQGILDGSLPFLCKDADLDLRDETEAVSLSRQEERSEGHLQVKNVADSADMEVSNTQSFSSPSVASDGRLRGREAESTGQSNSRVDVASPLTHTANTPRPEDGQQNLPPWLRSSWSSFSQRLSMLERAHSDLKEGLLSLSSQQDALHAQLKKLIPSGRLDRARQLEKGYSVLDARMNRLESQLQVLMDSFDRCAAGYIGNPLQGQACTFGNNDLNGNCQHCDRSGTERCDGGRICRCKAHVEGTACSSCRPGHFHLSPEHPEGCLKCFCMGITQQCSSSNYYRDTVSIAFSPGNFQDMALVNRQRTNRITTGFTVEVSTDGTQLSFSNFGNLDQGAHFWQLPEVFRGDKREAYYARMRRAHKKDSPWTEEQLRKDASIWKLMDSMGEKSSRSKRAVKSSAEIQKLDDEIWALISNFSKDPPPPRSQPIPSSLSSNRLPPPSGISSSSTRLPGSYYAPPEHPSHYSRPQARTQAQRGPNVVSLHGARPGSRGKYALVYKGFSLHPEDVLFWQLPPQFRGDKVGSYGGTLRYTISHVAGQRGTPIEDADVQLIGNDITLVSHQRWQRGQGARESRQFEVAFKEEHWRRPDGMPATREHLMMVLADLDDILIRASYYTDMLSASISDIRMEVSVPNYSGLAQALEVEQCRCPPGYQGLSCQDCAPGYSRTGGGLYLGHCELCECNGHSDTCHPETGVCTTCLHNTMGELCEQCASGYFGDPTAGTPEDCQPCACPHMDPDYQFSPTCESTGNGGYRCTACQPGYTGQYCERCAPGYEGDPQRRVRCRLSNNAGLLVVRVHPERVLVAQGNPVMLRCQVTGSPPHYFHWSREDRRPISGQAERRRQGEELYFPSIESSDAGVYVCTCRDQRSSNTSRAEIVVTTVARPIEVTVEEPKAQSVTIGSTVSFICTAKSQSPAYTLVWTRQGNRKLPHRAMDFNGILTIQNVQPDDAGVYVCTGSNMFAMDEGTAVLYVPASEGSQAIATAHPPVLTVQRGQRAEFRCTATGNPPPTVEWIGGHGNQISPHAVVRGGVLTITKVERSDEGEYICRASNTHGEHNARAVLYVHSASLPHVQVSPQRVQVNEGETLRLYCRAGGTPSPGLTWKKKGGPLPPQAIPSHGFHQFKTNSVDVLQRRIEELQARMERTDIGTLLIPNVRATDAGTYFCVGTNSFGSSEAPIEVSVASAEPFSTDVSIRPPVATVQEGQTLDLSCIIPGAPPVSVSWIRVGGHLPANHQVLGTQLRILNASPEDSGQYICRVDGGPTVRQASVTVTVTPRSPLEPLSHTVSTRPTVAIVREGQPLELICVIPGKTSAPVTWIRVGGHLPRNHQVSGTRLRILNPSSDDSGEYVCRVDGEPRARQASVTVSVVPRTSVEPSTHPVSIQPSTSTIREGQPLELTCVVPGGTPRSVTWIRVGGDLPRNHQVSGNRLRISNASPEDSGEYICRVDDGPTVQQASITVTIATRSPLEPFSHSVSIRPSTATIREGQALELDCVVPGSTPRSVTWNRVGGHLPRNHQVLGTRLRIPNPSPEDSGEYVCRVDNGRTVQQGSVTVSVTPRSSVEPFLHGVGIRPSTATVQVGQPLELNCVVPGSAPTSVTWIRVGGDLPRNHQVLGTRLRIHNPSPEDSGEYVCRVDDGRTAQQGYVTVSVTPSSSVEPFLHGVGIRPSTATVQVGQPLELNCVVPGSAPTSVTWIRVGGDLPRNHQVLGTRLRIHNPSPEDSGEYVCRVDDGRTAQQGYVTVSVTPSSSVEPFLHGVGIRPSTATVQVGQPLELNCVVPGSAQTSVTWIRVGGDLPRNHQVLGTRLRIHNPSPEDSGEYVCRVDDGRTVQQGSVTVSVTPSSSVEPFLHGVGTRPSTATVQVGQPLELNCVVPGSAPTSVTWIRVGGDLPRNHQVLGTRLRIFNPSPEDSGEYVCRVDDGPRVQQGSVSVSVTPSSSLEPFLHGVGIRPSTATVQVGQPLELNCVIPGSAPTSVTWIRVGGDLPRNHQVLGTRLRIPNPSPEDSGEYVCRVDDGPRVQQGSITVSVTPSSSVEPFFHGVGTRPSTATVQEGRPLELNCVVPGSAPTSVTWIRVGGDLPRNHQVSGTRLGILNPSPEDSGEYVCRVDDGRTAQQGSVTVSVTPSSSLEPFLHGVGIRPSTATVREGQPLEFNCVVPGSTPTSVTWIRVGGDLPRNHQVLGTRLRISNPSPEDSGEYVCRVDDGPRVQQGSVTVFVTPSSSVEPFSHGIGIRPSTATVQEGQPLELTCVVPGGTPTSVTWIRKGGDLPRNHQVLGTRLRISNTSPEDSGEYICRVEGGPTVQQASVTVTVAPRTSLEPLSHAVSIRPSVASVHEGQPLELDCVVPGSTPRSVTWRRVGGHLPRNHQVFGTRLRILNPSPEDSGEYVCRVDDGRTAQQGSVSVSVTPSSSGVPTSNGVSIRPSNATVQEGQPLELECVLPGRPPISVTWIRVGGDLPSNHQVLGTQLRILNASPADTGEYVCRVDDGSTVRQASVAVAVTPSSSTASSARLPTPTISIEPHRANVRQGDSASFRCRVHTGVRPVRLEWKLPNSRPMPDNVRVSPDGTVIVISNAQPIDQGAYRCVASNAFGMTHSVVSLIVKESPKAVVTPQGLVRVRVGEPINLECQGSGEPRPSVSWHRLDSGRRTVLTSPIPMDSNAVMQVLAARPEDSGTYICTVRNSEGLTEVAVEVRVDGEELAPSAPRASVPEPLLVVEEGQTATLRCHAYGHPTPAITWSKLRAPLPWRHRVVNNTLIVPGVARQDSGQYICNATNSLGTSEVTVMLDVETPPYATCLPDDLAVRVGEVIRLQCLSHGTPPLRFQWTKVNGSLSNRAEVDDGNLQINLATAADAGTYKCLVSNKVGSSEALAKVAVRSPLSVRVWPQVEVKAIGSAVEFTCSAAGGVQTTIEWIKEGGPMPVNHHINEGVLRIENLEQSDEGVYICRATGVYGQAQDTAKLTIQALPKVMINIRTSVQTVMIGNSVEFECHATGDPQPSVRWSKVGGELPAHVVVQGGMLKIERVEEADAGQYRCTATNNVGSVQSEVVLNVQSLPQIVSPPDEKEVNLGSGAVFPCVATGYPVPEIKWSKLDGELSSAAVVEGNVLTIPSVKQEDAGTYVCTASNKQGMVQAFTKLKVHERVMPHFTQTPLSYLTLPTIKNSYKAFNIKINFRPDSADGMIIYNGQKRKTGADFISLGLVGGRPEFRFDVGSGMATLRYPTPITLGEFHTVELHRNLTLGSIVVDGHPPVNGSSQGKFQGLDLNEDLFVGGYPNYTVITKKTGLKTGFIGCIRQLIIQGEEVVFKDLDQSSIGVSNCPSCKDRPCQHGGVCEDSETSIYKCSCAWGYTGSNCEHHSSLHCHPEACGADATCINRPSGLGYDCRCHLGKSGDKCTQGTLVTIPHFDGEDSFIAYPPLTNIHNDLRVEVEFKPLDPDGLMFFSGGKKMKVEDFVALSMVDGHVEFRYELGTGMAILRSREPITIGQWHHVVAERLNKDGFLKVDQDREVRRSSPGKAQGLNIHTPMYLGGVPSMDILPKPANVSMLFEGCVGEVSINGKKVDLSYSFTESRAISQCVDTNPCDRRPCLHGGSCLASAEYEYQCLCLDGFDGERCEVVKHVCQVDAQCKNGGKCADGQCVCPGGFSGLYCEHAYAAQARSILDTLWSPEGSGANDAPAQHAAYFHDDGYLALPKSIFPRSSPDAAETVELEIRSTTAEGLILWQGVEPSDGLRGLHAGTQELGEEGRGKDYISLGLQSGHLVFSYQLGSGEAEIFSEEPINDGKWHKITAVRTGRLGYVQVDGGAISRGQSQGSSIMVNTKGNVFLGGAPDITALTGGRFSSGITGCVKNLELVNARPGEQPARHIDLQAHAQEGINVERCSS